MKCPRGWFEVETVDSYLYLVLGIVGNLLQKSAEASQFPVPYLPLAMGVMHSHPQRVAEVPQDPNSKIWVPDPFGQSASLQLSIRVPSIDSFHDGVVVSDRRGKNWEVPDLWFHKCIIGQHAWLLP